MDGKWFFLSEIFAELTAAKAVALNILFNTKTV